MAMGLHKARHHDARQAWNAAPVSPVIFAPYDLEVVAKGLAEPPAHIIAVAADFLNQAPVDEHKAVLYPGIFSKFLAYWKQEPAPYHLVPLLDHSCDLPFPIVLVSQSSRNASITPSLTSISGAWQKEEIVQQEGWCSREVRMAGSAGSVSQVVSAARALETMPAVIIPVPESFFATQEEARASLPLHSSRHRAAHIGFL